MLAGTVDAGEQLRKKGLKGGNDAGNCRRLKIKLMGNQLGFISHLFHD